MKKKKFRAGDTIVFDPSIFNKHWWNSLPEVDRLKYYGHLGYGSDSPYLWTFICEHNPQVGHCMIISMRDKRIETMVHIDEFRLATEDEV